LAFSLRGQNCCDFFPLSKHKRIVDIALSLDFCEDSNGSLFPSDFGQPPGRSWQKGSAHHEPDTWYELESSSSPETGRWSGLNELAGISPEVHDKDTPLNGHLLDNNDAPSRVLLGYLGEVNWNLRRGNADTNPINKAATYQHRNSIAGSS
jgi:hypothetical protein